MDSWLLFAIASPVCWAFANVLDAALRRHYINDDATATIYLTLSRLPLIIIFFAIFGIEIPSIPIFVCMLVAGLLWMLPFILYFKAMECEEPTRVLLFMQLMPIFTLAIAYFSIGERLGMQQLLAFFILLAGGGLAGLKKLEGAWRFSKAFWFMAAASLMWAATDVMFKKFQADFSGFFSAFSIYISGNLLASFVLPVFVKDRKNLIEKFVHLPLKAWIFLGLSVVIGISGSIAFAYALKLGAASLTSVILGIQPLLVFIFGIILARFIREITKEDVSAKSLLIKAGSFALIILGLALL